MITPTEDKLLGALATSLTMLTSVAEGFAKMGDSVHVKAGNLIMDFVEKQLPLVLETQEQKDTP
jgi:hypothetical protein